MPSTGNSTNASAQNAMLLPASVAKLYYLSCPYRFSVLWVERRKLIFTVCLTHSKCYICCCQYFILRSKLQKMQLSLHFTDGKTEAQKVSCVSARSGTHQAGSIAWIQTQPFRPQSHGRSSLKNLVGEAGGWVCHCDTLDSRVWVCPCPWPPC